MSRTNATLNLHFEVQSDQTILRVLKQEPPLRVIRAFPIAQSHSTDPAIQLASTQEPGHRTQSLPDGQSELGKLHTMGQYPADSFVKEDTGEGDEMSSSTPALVHLHNISGGLLGGDQLYLNVTVGTHAQAQLTSTGSTRVYRYRQGYPTTAQTTHLIVEPHGLLEYLPDTLIPYARSQYRQTTRIELAEGAGLFYWEVVTPGREAKGECFEYDLLQIELDILVKEEPIAIERSRLEPARLKFANPNRVNAGLDSLTRLGSYRYFATFYICRVGVEMERWLQLEEQLDEEARKHSIPGQILWGVSTLPAHGLSVRAVSTSCHAIQQALPYFWQLAKERLYQQNAVMPRKMY